MSRYSVQVSIKIDTKSAISSINLLKKEVNALNRSLKNVHLGHNLDRELRALRTELSANTAALRTFTTGVETLNLKSKSLNRTVRKGTGLWERFGKAAVVFTLFYRGINAVEAGLQAMVEQIKQGILLSGQLVEIQSKMALWGTLFPSNATSFSDAFGKAAVNLRAFRDELPTALSSIDDLTQGLDEMAQHGQFATQKNMHAIVNLIDLISMIAKATGSTKNQVRQELQALYEGTDRAGNSLRMLLRNLGISTQEFIVSLRGASNKFSDEMDKVKEKLFEASPEVAMNRWQKSVQVMIQRATDMANIFEHGSVYVNVFAHILNTHAKAIEKNTELSKAWAGVVVQLASMFDKLLSVTEGFLQYLPGLIGFFSAAIPITLKWGGAFLFVRKAVKSLYEILTAGRLLASLTSLSTKFNLIAAAALAAAYAINKAVKDSRQFEANYEKSFEIFNKMYALNKEFKAFVAEKGFIPQKKEAVYNVLQEWFSSHEAEAGWNSAKGPIGDFIDKTFEWLEEYLKHWEKKLNVDAQKFGGGKGLAGIITKGITSKKVKDLLKKDLTDLTSFFKKLVKSGDFDIAKQLYPAVVQNIKDQKKALEKELGDLSKVVVSGEAKTKVVARMAEIKAKIRELNKELENLPKAIPSQVVINKVEEISQAFDNQRQKLKGYDDAIRSIAKDFLGKLTSLEEQAGGNISKVAQEKIEALRAKLTQYASVHKSVAKKVSTGWQHVYDNMVDGLANAIMRGESLLKMFANSIKSIFVNFLSKQIVSSIVVGLGLPGAAAWAGQSGGGTLSTIMSSVSSAGGLWNMFTGGLSNFGKTLMNAPAGVWNFFAGNSIANDYTGWGAAMASENELFGASIPSWLTGAPGAGLTAGLGTFLLQELLTGDWKKAAVSGAGSGIGAGIGTLVAPGIGTAIGALTGGFFGNLAGGLFGDGTERTYLRRRYAYSYDQDLGASYTHRTTRWDRGTPDWMDTLVNMEDKLARSIQETLTSVITTLDKFSPGFAQKMSGRSFEYQTYWGVEDKKEFEKRYVQNIVGFAKNILGPVIDTFKTDFKASLSGLDLSLFTDDFKNQVQEGYEKAFSQIDFSKIKTVDDLKKQFDNLNKVLESEKRLEAFVSRVKELDKGFKQAVGDLDEYHARLEDINDAWLKQKKALESMGVDLGQMPEFFGAWGKAIEDLKEQIFGFVLDVPEKFDEAWVKIIHDISQIDLGGKMVEMLNAALDDPSRLATVGQDWAQWLGDSMKSSVLSGAMDSLMDQVKQAYIQPIMQSMLGSGFGVEGIMSAFSQIDKAIPKLAEAGQSMAQVFGYIQQYGDLTGFNWDEWKDKYQGVWDEINKRNQEAAKQHEEAAKSLQDSAKALDISARHITSAADRLDAPQVVVAHTTPVAVNGA